MTGLIPPGQFNALTHPFQSSVFRLETLQTYRGSGEDEWIRLFEAGAAGPPLDPEQDAWESLIHGHRSAGRVLQRVHVLVEPLSDYAQFEVAWSYALSVAAGEDIRIIAVSGDDWPAGVPHLDFWLYDDTERFDALYAEDATWLGVQPVHDPVSVAQAQRWKAAALAQSQSWESFVNGHPDLAVRVPAW